MNAAAVWSFMGATIGRPRRTGSAIFAIFAIAIMLVSVQIGPSRCGIVYVLTYAGGLGFWWIFAAGRALIVQRDARKLCVPGIDAVVAVNLFLQYLVTAVLPAAILAVSTRASFANIAALFSCIVAGALMFQMLPRGLATLFSIVPLGMQQLNSHGLIPGLSDPGFAVFGWAFAIAALLIAVWRWRAIVGAEAHSFGGWRTPLVIQIQQQAGHSGGAGMVSAAIRSTLHRQVLLTGVDARTPVRALRVWLGGALAPVHASTRAVQVGFVVMPMLVPIAFKLIVGSPVTGWIYFAVVILGSLIPALTMIAAPLRLQRLYADPGGELSQLALLPGLDRAGAKRSLFQAALGLPLTAVACIYLITLSICLALGSALLLLAVTLSTLGAVAIGVAYSLAIMAGSAIPKFLLGAGTMLAITLTCVTPVLIPLRHMGATLGNAAAYVIVGWLLLYVLAAWLGVRALRTFAGRPHAFLLHDC